MASQSWISAEAEAVARGGHLVTINDAASNAALRAAFPRETLWIGLSTSHFFGGGWGWRSGAPASYQNWSPGYPVNHVTGPNGAEPFRVMIPHGAATWQNTDDTRQHPGIMEVSRVEATFSIVPVNVASKAVWAGTSLSSGWLRGTSATESLVAAFIDDTANPAGASLKDGFVIVEYEISGTSSVLRTRIEFPPANSNSSGAYGLTVLRNMASTKVSR